MTLRHCFFIFFIAVLGSSVPVFGQANTVIGQFTDSIRESFSGSISGDGRFVVFESEGNLATENPRNEDGNSEIFLFDFAQRRIFQLTDTKSVLYNTAGVAAFQNIRVLITNKRPMISTDGRWIVFSSNATTSTPTAPDSTNPGSFDGNTFTSPTPTPTATPTPSPTPSASPTPTPSPSATPSGTPTPTPTPPPNPLANDGNMEIWLYQIPAYAPADLRSGDEVPFTQLSGGSFVSVTNTNPSRLPQGGSAFNLAFVADDNHDGSLTDDGSAIAFVSTRDLVANGNAFPTADNDEIFLFKQGGGFHQLTRTPRGPLSDPIYNKNPTISGDGLRVVFASTGDDPVPVLQPTPAPSPLPSPLPSPAPGIDCGSNPSTSRNEEVFVVNLDPSGSPTGCRQITTTTPPAPGEIVNVLDLGKRMSRNGRYIAFDSYADLANPSPSPVPSPSPTPSFATYLYDYNANSFRQIGARSNADSEALGGDVQRYPGFTDYDANGNPATLLMTTRLNIKPDGTIPATETDGLNPVDFRPIQIYSYDLSSPPTSAIFTRLTNFPAASSLVLPQTQALSSNSSQRLAFNLALTELGTRNRDFLAESYYLYKPLVTSQTAATVSFFTGASRMPIDPTASPTPSPTPTPSVTPTPSPTATPTPTPTPSPTPSGSPTVTPTPVPTPTPVTPPTFQGLSPGMLATITFSAGIDPPIVPRTAVGSLDRSFNLPMELSGVTMSINGAMCGMKSVGGHEITFVVPEGLNSALTGTAYPFVVNNNGVEIKGSIAIVPSRPDIFTTLPVPGPGGRADLQNVTNRVHTTEPFTVTTIKEKGGHKVSTIIRMRATGILDATPAQLSVRIGAVTITGAQILSNAVQVEPGIFQLDFVLPASLNLAGDQPVVLSTIVGTTIFTSRLDDTAPKVRIL